MAGVAVVRFPARTAEAPSRAAIAPSVRLFSIRTPVVPGNRYSIAFG
jgi:hypothetical protein